MLPNPQIGAPAAPSSPQSLSFQSDPSQRAQFKGFMNNLSVQPAPIPAPVTVPAANVDIFEPVGYADGGAVGALQRLHQASGAMAEDISRLSTGAGMSGFGSSPIGSMPSFSQISGGSQPNLPNPPAQMPGSIASPGPVAPSVSFPRKRDYATMMEEISAQRDSFPALQVDKFKPEQLNSNFELPSNHMTMTDLLGNSGVRDFLGSSGVQGFADGGYAEAAYGGESNYGDVSYDNFDNGSGYDDPGDDVMDVGYSAGQVDPGLAMAARGQGRANFTAGPAPTAEDSALDQAIFNTLAATNQQNVNTVMSQPDVMASRTDLQRGLDSRQNTATAGDALGRQMAAIEARSPIESSVDARTQPTSATLLNIDMFGDTYSGNMTPGQRDAALGLQETLAQAQMNRPSAADDSYDPYQSIKNLAELSKMKSAIDSEYMGTPAPRPQRAFVSPDIPVMSDAERADMERADAGPNMSMASPYDMVSPKIPPQVGELGAMGAGAFPAVPTTPGIPTTPADPNAPMTDFERNNGLDMMADLADKTTTTTLGFPGQQVNALEQLARRAQASPGSFAGKMSGMAPGPVSGILGGLLGGKAASQMYSDIAERGFIPQFDSTGQIVATINPQTGQFGKGSVESRIAGYTPPEEGNEPGDTTFLIAGGGNQGQASTASEAEEIANILGGLTQAAQSTTTATPAAPSGPTPLGMPLQFGYGQVSSNLNNALSNFFNLLGGK